MLNLFCNLYQLCNIVNISLWAGITPRAYNNFKKKDFVARLELSSKSYLGINGKKHLLDNGWH